MKKCLLQSIKNSQTTIPLLLQATFHFNHPRQSLCKRIIIFVRAKLLGWLSCNVFISLFKMLIPSRRKCKLQLNCTAVYLTWNNFPVKLYLLFSDRQIYHRRVQKEASFGGAARYVLRYPEVLIDRDAIATPKVISCIRCQDLQRQTERENSVCKVVAGGVGHTFVTLLILSKPNAGYDYDVKIMGQ